PELPAERRDRYVAELGLSDGAATQLAFDVDLGDEFERVLEVDGELEPQLVANWITEDLVAARRQAGTEARDVQPGALATLVGMVAAKDITHAAGREVLGTLVALGGDPARIVEEKGLARLEDEGELDAVVEAALASDPSAAEQVRAGNMKAIGPLVGYVMRETQGRADGGEVTRLIRAKLGIG